MNSSYQNFNKRNWIYCCLIFMLVLAGCKKFVSIAPPVNQITATKVFNDNNSASAVMTGLYSAMMQNPTTSFSDGFASISMQQGLAADELTKYSNNLTLTQFYQNALSSSTAGSTNYYYWKEFYNELHIVNTVIEGLGNSTGVTPAMKQQLVGEAKFMRAFLHFYAVNLYGDIPLIITSNYLVTNKLSRSSKEVVYQQIIQDLKDAQSTLSTDYRDPYGVTTTQRIRPNKATATALLARVYLYHGDWSLALAQATSLTSNSTYNLLTDLSQVFKSNSAETIWQMVPVVPNYNTADGYYFVLSSTPATGTGQSQNEISLSASLVASFEAGDRRFNNWVGSYSSSGQTWYYPYKYQVYKLSQPVTENKIVFRLAEQYLIKAEAEANGAGGGISEAINDLNIIRTRAGLANYNGATTQADVLAAILHERQIELFSEWGHRWFDLIRTGNINSVMGSPGNVCSTKGGTWSPNWTLLPLPYNDLQLNPNLTQNTGY